MAVRPEDFGAEPIAKVRPEDFGAVPTGPSDLAVGINAAYKGLAGLPDSILNTPNNLLNLGRAGVGTVAGALGRPDLMPDIKPNPDWARRTLESVGIINPAIQPQGTAQKAIDYGVQGVVGGALTGGAGLARSAVGAGLGGLSGLSAGGVQEATGNPALAATAGMLPGGASGVKTALTNYPKQTALKSQNYVKDETLANAQKEGYKVPPSAVEPSFIGNRIEGVAGKAALNQEATLQNQPITNKIARREAGLKPDEPISEGTLEAARNTIAQPYREVGALSPIASKALEGMKQARADAKMEWNHYGRSLDPAALKRAQALDNKADLYETVIEKVAAKQGNPDLVDRLREARVSLAKNYTVDRALNVGSGDVDAQIIGRMYDKAPQRFDGGLETIGRFANAFRPWTRDAANVPAPGVSKLEALASFGFGTAGHVALPGFGAIAAAIPFAAPPVARSLALSPLMQGPRTYGAPGILSQTAQQTSPIVTQGILSDIYRNQNR